MCFSVLYFYFSKLMTTTGDTSQGLTLLMVREIGYILAQATANVPLRFWFVLSEILE